MKLPVKPHIRFDRHIGYWVCGGRGTYAIAAGCTLREAYEWWVITRNVT
jgi:hypothetical protein